MSRRSHVALLLALVCGQMGLAQDQVGVWMTYEKQSESDKAYKHFISISQADECGTIVAYVPVRSTVRLYNPPGRQYDGEWFNPVTNDHPDATVAGREGMIEVASPQDGDLVLVLHRKS